LTNTKEDHMTARLLPISATERIPVIDQLRGFAIFGILVVNMFYFFHPFFAPQLTAASSAADRAAGFLITFLFLGKFYTLFSFLFGLGLHVQMTRAEASGRRLVPVYLRRLLVLAVLGLAHGVLLWIGDILLLYAVTGLLLLWLFRNRSPRTLKAWAIVLLTSLVLLIGGAVAALTAARYAPPESGAREKIEADFAAIAAEIDRKVAEDYVTYATGDLGTITRARWRDYSELLTRVGPWMLPSVLAMFLLGLRAGKRGWFEPGPAQEQRCRRLLRWALPLGLLLNFYVAVTGFEQNRMGVEIFTWQTVLQITALTYGSVMLALSWVALMILADCRGTLRGLRGALAPVGRMALSNYLLQSVVMTTLAFGYGFGLYGQVGLAVGLGLALGFFALQIPLSRWWLARYRFGPVEWLWRTLTYGRLQQGRSVETVGPESG